MRVLFLDFDGVLNSREWAEKQADLPVGAPWFDPAAVARLNRLLSESGACVVISSYWRNQHIDDLKQCLADVGCEPNIIGITPFLHPMERGREIQSWLDMPDHQVDSFVILDDYDDMGELLPRLVKTDWAVGLTDADVDRAIALFGVAS